jgi:hypothetical protein
MVDLAAYLHAKPFLGLFDHVIVEPAVVDVAVLHDATPAD